MQQELSKAAVQVAKSFVALTVSCLDTVAAEILGTVLSLCTACCTCMQTRHSQCSVTTTCPHTGKLDLK